MEANGKVKAGYNITTLPLSLFRDFLTFCLRQSLRWLDEWSLMRKGQKANQREFPFNGQNYPPTDNRVELEPACTIRRQVNFSL